MRTDAPSPSVWIDRRLLAVNAALLGGALGSAIGLSVTGTAATALPLGVVLGIALAAGLHRVLARLARSGLGDGRRVAEPTADSSGPAAR
jgi:hypothetical protein